MRAVKPRLGGVPPAAAARFPEPSAPAVLELLHCYHNKPANVTVHVRGSLVSAEELATTVRREFQKQARRNWPRSA